MHDGVRELTCRAAIELLRNRFGRQVGHGDERAFACNRDAIERAAGKRCRAGKTEIGFDPEIVVTEWDMASPLSRKL